MTDSCFRVSRLLDRRNLGLSEAERLVLERHLTSCSDCRSDSALLRGLSELSEQAAAGARLNHSPDRLIARAIERAQRADATTESAGTTAWGRPGWMLAFSLAVAAACLALFLRARHHDSSAPIATTDSVLSGALSVAGQALPAGAHVPAGALLTVVEQSELALAHAHVRTTASTSPPWHDRDACLELASGAVDVSVDPAPHRPFSVKTARFRVDVLGTEFHVDGGSVSVARGRVRVSNEDGVELALLEAGQRWLLDTPKETTPIDSADPSAEEPPAAPIAAIAPVVTASESLTLARHALASGDVPSARHAIDLALAAHPRPSEQAEAHMLLGDAARIAGNTELSSHEYLTVFERYRSLPLAESALFSAARVEARAGHHARAEQLFSRYLAAYPRGQFRTQALERVQGGGT